jgi:hypothetical protein
MTNRACGGNPRALFVLCRCLNHKSPAGALILLKLCSHGALEFQSQRAEAVASTLLVPGGTIFAFLIWLRISNHETYLDAHNADRLRTRR